LALCLIFRMNLDNVLIGVVLKLNIIRIKRGSFEQIKFIIWVLWRYFDINIACKNLFMLKQIRLDFRCWWIIIYNGHRFFWNFACFKLSNFIDLANIELVLFLLYNHDVVLRMWKFIFVKLLFRFLNARDNNILSTSFIDFFIFKTYLILFLFIIINCAYCYFLLF